LNNCTLRHWLHVPAAAQPVKDKSHHQYVTMVLANNKHLHALP